MTTHVAPTTPPLAAPARTALTVGRPLLKLVEKIIPRHPSAPPGGRPPTQRPSDRSPAAIDSIRSYTPGIPVWAHIGGAWLTATVASTTGSSVLVAYAVPGSGETTVETVHATRLQLRDKPTRHRSDTPPSNDTQTRPKISDAGRARAILGSHRADEHGMCAACAYLAHFCWAPCPQARRAMSAPATEPAQTGTP